MKINELKPAQRVMAGYVRRANPFLDLNVFLGFTDASEQYGGSGPKFRTLADAFFFYSVTSLEQLEAKFKAQPYGTGVYACFQEVEADGGLGLHWRAYLFDGAYRVGTSADRLRLEVPV